MTTRQFTEDDLRRLLDLEAADVGHVLPRAASAHRSGRRVRRVLPALAAAVVVALALVTVAVRDTAPRPTPSHAGAYLFGGAQRPPALIPIVDRRPAENVTGPLLSGRGAYDLSTDARNEVTVVNFWGAWCGPCQVEVPQLQAIQHVYGTQNVSFVGIDVLEASRGLPRAFVAKYKITYPMIYDADGRTAVTLGNIPAQGAPYTVLLDRQHRVAAVYLQRLGARELRTALDQLLLGR